MPNYKEMYLKMFQASEKAADILLTAQKECEELYLSAPKSELKIMELHTEKGAEKR